MSCTCLLGWWAGVLERSWAARAAERKRPQQLSAVLRAACTCTFAGLVALADHLPTHTRAWLLDHERAWLPLTQHSLCTRRMPACVGVTARTLTRLPGLPPLCRQYREYLTSLVAYLESFYRRTQPLAQMHKQLGRLEAELEERWGPGQVQGWEDRGRGQLPPAELPIDLEVFESPEELETIGGGLWQHRGSAALGAAGALA